MDLSLNYFCCSGGRESDLLVKCSSLIHSELKGLELSMETLGTLWTLENWPHPNFEL